MKKCATCEAAAMPSSHLCNHCETTKYKATRRWGKVREGIRRYGGDITRDDWHELTGLDTPEPNLGKSCHWCERPVLWWEQLTDSASKGGCLDQLDPAGGYYRGNVVPSCWPCNMAKGRTPWGTKNCRVKPDWSSPRWGAALSRAVNHGRRGSKSRARNLQLAKRGKKK